MSLIMVTTQNSDRRCAVNPALIAYVSEDKHGRAIIVFPAIDSVNGELWLPCKESFESVLAELAGQKGAN